MALVRGAGWVGVAITAATIAKNSTDENNYVITEDYEKLLENPAIRLERRKQHYNDSEVRQKAARAEALNAKSMWQKFKETPSVFGASLGTFFTFQKVPGLGLNTFGNLKARSPFASVKPKLPNTAEKLTKGQIIEYLQKVDKVPMKQLRNDLEKLGLELYEPPKDGIYKLIHWRTDIRKTYKSPLSEGVPVKLENCKFIIEIHKGKGGLDFDHMHITDRFGNLYDKHLNNLTAKLRKDNPGWHARKLQDKVERLPEAHIKIREFVELNMRPENV